MGVPWEIQRREPPHSPTSKEKTHERTTVRAKFRCMTINHAFTGGTCQVVTVNFARSGSRMARPDPEEKRGPVNDVGYR